MSDGRVDPFFGEPVYLLAGVLVFEAHWCYAAEEECRAWVAAMLRIIEQDARDRRAVLESSE